MKTRRPKWQIGGWGPSPLGAEDLGPPRRPRNTQRSQRLALEKKLADAGAPRRRGRRAEQEYQRRVKKERRAEADRPRRPGVPRSRSRPSSRTREARLGKPHRVIILALVRPALLPQPSHPAPSGMADHGTPWAYRRLRPEEHVQRVLLHGASHRGVAVGQAAA